jgi:hypothetical protein
MDDQTKAAFASAADSSKQLITLATAMLTLEVTFSKNILETPGPLAQFLIAISWVCLLLSVLAGVLTLLALTGSLGSTTAPPTAGGINSSNITRPAMFQVVLFLAGLLLTVVFGMTVVW